MMIQDRARDSSNEPRQASNEYEHEHEHEHGKLNTEHFSRRAKKDAAGSPQAISFPRRVDDASPLPKGASPCNHILCC
jgi:hypothetical protein